MKKNTLENMCVYYKDAEGLRFEKQEHIIPAFLGGKKMLDQGVVSDQANELFSGKISRFLHDSSGCVTVLFFLNL